MKSKLRNLKFCQNSKKVKTENFYKLGPKICPPPPDFGKGKPEQPKVLAHG